MLPRASTVPKNVKNTNVAKAETNDLATAHGEADVVHCEQPVVTLGKPASFEHVRSGGPMAGGERASVRTTD